MTSWLNTVRDLDRLRQIVAVLARHGFGEVVQRTGLGQLLGGRSAQVGAELRNEGLGERIRLVLQDLGPSFIKLGQIVSTRPDLVPESILVELRKLQDDVAPLPFDQLRPCIEEQLGAPLEALFEAFDETPMASASIGQVHRARLKTEAGVQDVVVKIQRPNIQSIIERDIDLLYWLAHAIERSIPEASIYSPVRLVGEFDRAISAELDYALEADNAERFAFNFKELPTARFPSVFRSASSRRVITLEYLPGKKVLDALKAGASGEAIARAATEIMIKMIFEHGFFHADPHPGNVLIMGAPDAPVLGIVDLGFVGRLSPKLRDRTIDLMIALAREDHRAMVDAILNIGNTTRKVDRDRLETEIMQLADRYVHRRIADIELSSLIRDLIALAMRHGLEIPPDFVMVGKALMTVEGVGKQIYPELNVMDEVRPYFLQLAWQRYSPEKVTADLLRLATQLTGAAGELPLHAQEILDDLRRGRLRLEIREPGLSQAADRLGRRIFSGLVVGGLVVAGAISVSGGQWRAGLFLYATALGAAAIYGLSLAFERRK